LPKIRQARFKESSAAKFLFDDATQKTKLRL
jgi:hypothetical protein